MEYKLKMNEKFLKIGLILIALLGFIASIYSIIIYDAIYFLIGLHLFVIFGIGIVWLLQKKYLSQIIYSNYQNTEKIFEKISISYRQIEALNNLFYSLKPRMPLPQMRGWAASPDFLCSIIKTIIESKPNYILETGCGVSTLVMAYTIENYSLNSKITCLEHDKQYADRINHLIGLHGLSGYVDIVYAPLANTKVDQKNYMWYDLSQKYIPNDIDMLVIDGPPADSNPIARYPAIPLLWGKIRNKCAIMLDDYEREGEKKVVEMWLNNFKLKISEEYNYDKGLVVIVKDNEI
jgi:predicted O-methyltransferase YrrM